MADVDSVARVVGALGLGVAVASLGWQVLTWRKSGRSVQIFAGPGRAEPGQHPVVIMHVAADGRLDVQVVSVGVEWSGPKGPLGVPAPLEHGQWIAQAHQRSGVALPHTLKAGHSGLWVLRVPDQEVMSRLPEGFTMAARVQLGDNQIFRQRLRSTEDLWG